MAYHVYILREIGGKKTYVGYTVDLVRRLRQHNSEIKGGAKYTSGKKWEFAGYFTGFPTSNIALQCEWRIKHPTKKNGSGMKGRLESIKTIFLEEKLTSNSIPIKDLSLELFLLEEYLPIELPDNIQCKKLEPFLMEKKVEKRSEDTLKDCKN